MSIRESIQCFLRDESLNVSQKYLIGVSGGRDSMVLLHALLDYGFKNLVVCHLNHSLRGSESDADEVFVIDFCKERGLECETKKVKVNELPESMETAARKARHDFFQHVGGLYGTERVFLAHHADDQAETVLFNLFRGCSRLQGMAQVTSLEETGLCLMRPLLKVPRNSIDQYLEANAIEYREDSSNKQAVAARNRIRNEVMPLLNSIMKRDIAPIVNRTLESSVKLNDFLLSQICFTDFLDPQGRLYLPAFQVALPAIQSQVMVEFLASNSISNITQDLVHRAVCLAMDVEGSAKLNLPENQFLRRKEKRLFIEGLPHKSL